MGSEFRLNLNLKQFATVQIAINFLNHRGINNKIKQHFKKYTEEYYNDCAERNYGWRNHYHDLLCEVKKWMNELVDQVDLLTHIPTSMKQEIKYMIPKLGEKKIAWLERQYIRMRANFPSIIYPNFDYYCNNLHWTSIGTIDEIKTFESLYHQWSNGNSAINVFYLFEEASHYCLKDYVMKIWNECSKDDRKILSIKNDGYESNEVVKYWRWIASGKPDHSGDFYSVILDEPYIRQGNVSAYEYFTSITKRIVTRDEIDEDSGNECENDEEDNNYDNNYDDNNYFDDDLFSYESNAGRLLDEMGWHESFEESICLANKIDLLIIFFQRMSNRRRQSLIKRHNLSLLCNFSAFWPWQTIITSILNISWDSISEDDHRIYLWTLMKIESKYNETEKVFCKENLLNDSCNLRMLYEIWNITPISFKHSICREPYFVPNLADAFPWTHIPFFVFIMNDVDIQPVKKEIWRWSAEYCGSLIVMQKYEILDCFVENVISDNEERISFKKVFPVHEIIERLLYDSNIKQRAERFLSWLFQNEDEVIHFKKSITLEQFRDWIIKFRWNHYYNYVKSPREALQWLVDFLDYSESDLMDLRTFLKSDVLFREAFGDSACEGHQKDRDILSICCKFTPEEVEQLKMESTNDPEEDNASNLSFDHTII